MNCVYSPIIREYLNPTATFGLVMVKTEFHFVLFFNMKNNMNFFKSFLTVYVYSDNEIDQILTVSESKSD
jgi:hypothetical protein